MEADALVMALALSLRGSLHCMGMCGGFAMLANASELVQHAVQWSDSIAAA